jgi:hypothetical protein
MEEDRVAKEMIVAFIEDHILWMWLGSVLQLFEGINAILFLVASSDYDQTLREETSVNRLREAVSLFDDVWHSRWKEFCFFGVLHLSTDLLNVQLLQIKVCFWQKLFRKKILLDIATKPYL